MHYLKPFSRTRLLSGLLLLLFCNLSHAQSIRELGNARGKYIGSVVTETFHKNPTVPANYREVFNREFNIIMPENAMEMDDIQPTRGNFTWRKTEEVLAFAEKNNMRTRGHVLVWYDQIPKWIKEASPAFTRRELLDVLKNHIFTVMGHFKGRIHEWNVVNEVFDVNGRFRGEPGSLTGNETSLWYNVIGPEYLDSVFTWARQADPTAELYFSENGVEFIEVKQTALINCIRGLKSRGVPVDGVALEAHIKKYNLSDTDISIISGLVDSLASTGVLVAFSELDIGIPKGMVATDSVLQVQGHSYALLTNLFMQKPCMKTMMMWGFNDRYSWLVPVYGRHSPLLFDAQNHPKPAYDSVVSVLKRYPPIGLNRK